VRYELQMETFIEPNRITLGECLDIWLNNYKKLKVRRTTFGNYETMIRTYIKPALGNIPLKQIQPSTLQSFYTYLLENGRKKEAGGLSPRMVHYVHALIYAALNQAVKENLIFRNPADAIELPKMQKREMEPMTKEEISRFLEAIREDWLYPAFFLALKTGLRRGEILGLRWKDIDFLVGEVSFFLQRPSSFLLAPTEILHCSLWDDLWKLLVLHTAHTPKISDRKCFCPM